MSASKIIIVGVDFSPRAVGVMDAARLMAERMQAKVVLVSALEGLDVVAPEITEWDAEAIRAEQETLAREALARASERFGPGTIIEQTATTGPAWRVIQHAAERHHAALIVIGAHAYRPMERLLGTTAAKIANRAACSVLIVRGALGFERVAVAHDGSERAPQVLAAAVSLEPQRLSLIRAVMPPADFLALAWGKRPDEVLTTITQNERTRLDTLRATLPQAITTDSVARVGAPADVVTDAARERGADLIVIGSHGFDPIDRLLGTTAARIVNQADRSVLIVR